MVEYTTDKNQSEQQNAPNTKDVTVSEVPKVLSLWRKLFLFLFPLLILTIGAVVSYLILTGGEEPAPKRQVLTDLADQKPDLATGVFTQAEALVEQQKYDEAMQLFDTSIAQTKDVAQKALLFQFKASMAFNNAKYQQAIDAAIASEKITASTAVSEILAGSYEALGNRVQAIEYYRKAIEQMPTVRGENEAAQILLYETKIRELSS